MADESGICRLVKSRGHIRTQITKLSQNVKANIGEFSKIQKHQLISKLKSLLSDLKSFNEQIQRGKWGELKDEDHDEYTKELQTCDSYEDKVIESIAILEDSLPTSKGNGCHSHNKLTQPTVPLPKFESKPGESIERFLRGFEAVVNQNNYEDYPKFLLLKQQVSGRASYLINSLESSKQSYKEAKDILQSALASPLNLKFEAIQRLVDLKLNYETDPYYFISEFRIIKESFASLKVDINMILQFFIWNAMNDTFRNQLISITLDNKPSLDDIETHFFEATERYLVATKKFNDRKSKAYEKSKPPSKSSTSMAVNVSSDKPAASGFRSCSLCSKEDRFADHPLHKCTKFDNPKDKVEELKRLKGCTRCGYLSHEASSCRFRFNSKCRNCKQYHFSFLCQDQQSSTSEHKPNKKETKKKSEGRSDGQESNKESSFTVWSRALFSSLNEGSVLPTFTGDLSSGRRIRGMKDTGCQVNFVSERLAKDENFKVIRKNYQVIVNGFNAQKEYSTNIVLFKIKLGKQWYNLEAICVPYIEVNLKLPCLGKIVTGFTDKGYKMADEFLTGDSDGIPGIDLVLGAEASYCIPDETVLFGNSPKPSVYCRSELGVMLIGNTGNMLRNLSCLPSAIQSGTCLASVNSVFSNKDVLGNKMDRDLKAEGFSDQFESRLYNLEMRVDSLRQELLDQVIMAEPPKVSANFSVLNERGKIDEAELERATQDILDSEYRSSLNYEQQVTDEVVTERNKGLIQYVLENTDRAEDGRIIMPLLWNEKVCHLLGENYNLSRQILKSNFKKLSKNEVHLKMTDDVFKEQEQWGIIERIDNIDTFREEHPNVSFLPHMSIIKMKRESTKCRVVFLSNLAEREKSKPLTLSHNQTIYPGPNLNQKLNISLLQLRFGEHLLCFDLMKAFLMIGLREVDQNRLLFLWYRNVSRNDFTVIAYRMKRLAFGLTCSPCILMLALYKILILDSEDDNDEMKELKHLVYALSYMDNGAYTTDDRDRLVWAFQNLQKVFSPYKFALQQFVSNHLGLQLHMDESQEPTPEVVKLLGIKWNRITDTLSTNKLHLSMEANTKRLILRSIHENFDPFNFNGPLLNRARIFMHELQTNRNLNWDTQLSEELMRSWKNICKQVNSAPEISIKRFVGRRDGRFRLLAFTDSSKVMYGTVLYIQDLESLEVSFLLAKNKLVCKQLQSKTIPSLEFHALVLGAETLVETYRGLAGERAVVPIKIEELQVFTDSMICIDWINAYVNKFEKLYQKRSVFILNRLDKLSQLCELVPIKFSFVQGESNPADAISRPFSYKQLMKSCYFLGPKFLKSPSLLNVSSDVPSVVVPNPCINQGDSVDVNLMGVTPKDLKHLIPIEQYSNFYRLVALHGRVLKLVNKWKLRLRESNPVKYEHIHCYEEDENFFALASHQIIARDQSLYFPEVFEYLLSKSRKLKDIPDAVSRLNVYPDAHNILRVKSKCEKGKDKGLCYFPILLAKESPLTKLIVLTKHEQLSHIGKYALLHELRKEFYVPQYFSLVKSVLKDCIVCKRLNARPIKLNQSPYRDFRISPKKVPFNNLFLDHLGPYNIKRNEKRAKAYILCLTCLWSRSVNLVVCHDLTADSFLRAFQLHIFQYGLPEKVFSDLGSQIVAASNTIRDYLKDPATQIYMNENGIQATSFEQYYKGNSALGSVVEICVKMTKRLLFGAIRNNILNDLDFEFFVSQTLCLINKRPIAFQDTLRDDSLEELPEVITPELVLKGYHSNVFNIIPKLHQFSDTDVDWTDAAPDSVRKEFSNLCKVRKNLNTIYNQEFLSNLISQAVSKKDRYKAVKHQKLKKGDIVLLQENHLKCMNYPLGVVKDIKINDRGEVTGASVRKGKTGEITHRHVNSLIPLLTCDTEKDDSSEIPSNDGNADATAQTYPKRQAAAKAMSKWRDLLASGLF